MRYTTKHRAELIRMLDEKCAECDELRGQITELADKLNIAEVERNVALYQLRELNQPNDQ